MKKEIKVYVQAMGFLTRAEGMKTRVVSVNDLETVDAIKPIDMLPDHLGKFVNVVV